MTQQPLSPLAWRILSALLQHAERTAQGEPLIEMSTHPLTWGYYATWTLERVLGTQETLEPAIRELIDKGLIEEMEDLRCRYRLRVAS